VAVISSDQGIKGSYDAGTCAEHKSKAYQPEGRSANAKVHQILHQDISGIFCSGKTCFTHRKTCLHEKYHCCSKQYPDCVNRTVRHKHSFFLLLYDPEFPPKLILR
jgi:hypothetical protein